MKTFKKQISTENIKFMIVTLLFAVLMLALQSCSEEVVEPLDDTNTGNNNPVVTDESTIDFDYRSVVDTAVVNTLTGQYYEDGSSQLGFQFYEVKSSSDDQRPLVILAPGGGWREYNQTNEIKAICNDLAKRGYATAFVYYTVGGQNGDIWTQSFLDMQAAVKYFKKNATDYRIHPDLIFTGGWSTGAQLSMYAANMDKTEYDNIDQSVIHDVLNSAIAGYGFEPALYQEYSGEVKGTLLLMPYAWDIDMFEADGPAVMMIANPNSVFGNNSKLWGEFTLNGINHIGPDVMFERLKTLNYVEGGNLEYLLTDPSLDAKHSHINYTSLDPMYYDAIANFFANNLD